MIDMSNDYRRLISALFLIVGVLSVVGGTLHPDAALPFRLDDRYAHAITYYVLTILFITVGPRSAVLSLGLLVGLAVTTEIAQMFVPKRQADEIDLLANTVGIGAAYLTWWLGVRAFRRVSRSL